MAHWASWRVPPSIPENRTQKHPELTSLQYFEIYIPKYFQKWKFSFFSIFSNFFSNLCLGSSDRLTNYWDILKSVGKVVEKFEWNFGKISSLEGTLQTS